MSISEPEVYSYVTWLLSMDSTCFDDVDLVSCTEAIAAHRWHHPCLASCLPHLPRFVSRTHLTALRRVWLMRLAWLCCSPACCVVSLGAS